MAAGAAAVLVVGAAGTGRALVARQLHRCSGRIGPFVAHDTTHDEALFGAGGAFERARGGTLYIDDLADLSLALQSRLLRSLQDGVDVRLVAATRVDLARAVAAGTFRRDLWLRLAFATIRLPALRERPADIVPLARHFVLAWSARLGLAPPPLSGDAVAALHAYPWPGNLRELEDVVHHALLVATDGVLRARDLALPGAPAPAGGAADDLLRRPGAELDDALRTLMRSHLPELHAHIEQRLVHNAYELCAQNQVRTARLLGISRNVLRAQLVRFGYLTRTGERRAVRPRLRDARDAATGA